MASDECESETDGLDSMLYENDEHQSSFLAEMKSMYDSEQLIDVTLCVQTRKFPCHKTVLAASSPYFRAMFTSDFNDSKQSSVDLYDVDPVSVNLVVEYSYSGKVEINRTNAQNLLAAASLFQITPIYEACARFMGTQLDAANCVGIHYFALIHGCEELQRKAKEHIEKNFVSVSLGDEYLSLPVDKVEQLLGSNELNVEKEETVFEALSRWIRHEEERSKHMKELIQTVRFGLLSSRYIEETVKKNTAVVSCDKCQEILSNVSEFESNPDIYHGDHSYNVILRSGMIKPEHCILLIGGVNQSRPVINCYNPITRESYYISDFQEGKDTVYYDVEDPACVITGDNEIFVAGGNYVYHENLWESPSDEDSYDEYEEETVRKDFYMYDNDHNTWVEKAPMLFPKSNFVLAYVDGKIYCFGGLTINQHPTEIIERYDIALNRWSYVGMMPTTLVDLSAVVYNSVIYILGGRTGVGAHNIVMKYDPKKSEWTSLAGMPTPRFKFGACVVDDEIYVAGGQIYSHSSHKINREALNSVEIYSIRQNQWRQGPELPGDMYNVGLFLVGGSMFVCGTTEFQRSVYRIYRYNVVYKLDMVKGNWIQIESDLCDVRDFACVAAKMHTRKLSQVFRPEVDT